MTYGSVLVLACLIVVCAVTSVNSSNEVIEKNKVFSRQCMKKFPVKKRALSFIPSIATRKPQSLKTVSFRHKGILQEMYQTYTVPENKNLKCFLGCLLTNLGVIKSNYIDWNVSRTAHKKISRDIMVRRKVDLMIKKCKKEVIPDFRDTCKLAADLISCKLKYSKRLGIPIMRMK
ncbi:uncharacterized protein isoform X1 [Rhodnius prolixus]|uniref:uncharacterized protein isoform X1 n=1 Tax=Rhodnius prolixus TaxID=13249 RepID=UPI003D187F7E